jgi:DNA-binding MarR family transcriptional regulator
LIRNGSEDPIGFRVFNAIAIIEQLARVIMERRLPNGLRISHFAVLNHFVRLGDGKSPLELARAFQVTKGAMTNTVRRLQNFGFVTIVPNPRDGRGKLVHLTSDGRKARDDAVRAIEPFMRKLYQRIAPEEFESALPFLMKLAATLDESREPDPNAQQTAP